MKRYGNLYSKICNLENLMLAHKNARKRKTFYSEVMEIDSDPMPFLIKLQNSLINHTYQTSEYTVFDKFDSGKIRTIYKLPYYPDRITHWAIMQVIEPIIMSTFTINTCASIPGRGIRHALDLENEYLKDEEGTKYCLKLDVKKFFPSIDHEILISLLHKKFKDPDLLDLLEGIIHSVDSGVPIGNYLSQYFANFYLTYFDHWLKEEKKVKYYIRYMDDIVIYDSSKEYLHKLRLEIEDYLATNLKLRLKENWQVFPTRVRGSDFIGYRHFGDKILLRKNILYKIRKLSNRIRRKQYMSVRDYGALNSYLVWIEHCDSEGIYYTYIYPLSKYIDNYMKVHNIKGGN